MALPVMVIVEDEQHTREGLAQALGLLAEVRTAADGRRGLELARDPAVRLVLTDVRMPVMDGFALLDQLHRERPDLPIIVITAFGSIDNAVEAMKRGARDYLTKPVNLDEVLALVGSVLGLTGRSRPRTPDAAAARPEIPSEGASGMRGVVGESASLLQAIATARKAAPSNATVFIQGETGTGKELFAVAIHRMSRRAEGPFIAVNCGGLVETLLESELFGHEKGAFTHAFARRDGRFLLADKGTVFLDEVGELSAPVQAKLLRFLQERTFQRVGGNDTITVDVRVVCATNRDLAAMVAAGTFREDLFYRLRVVVLTLPPLRDRPGDIPLLVKHFVEGAATRNGLPVPGVDPALLDFLQGLRWPGNVRQLQNCLEGMVVLSQGSMLTLDDLPADLRAPAADHGPRLSLDGDVTVHELERELVIKALARAGGNKVKAARSLGMSRKTLYRKLHEYGMLPEDKGGIPA